ncbi:MAG: hypothetical protein AAB345_03985 [Patescibacteria group bacterium]
MIQFVVAISFFAVAALVIFTTIIQGLMQSARITAVAPTFKKGETLYWSSFGRLMLNPTEREAVGHEPLVALAVEPIPKEWEATSFHPQAVVLQTREWKVKKFSGAYFRKTAA